ncbi:MAG: TlpA disulfide reductase family protein [Steroidobacteraceae bacterium]|nr:TlpA disulfide reductase family protein [Steroidobacteraceae bacterium]
MTKPLRFLFLGLVLLGGAVLGFYVYDREQRDSAAAAGPLVATKIPDTRPVFSLKDPEGRVRSITEWDGKSLMVNFWATWCAPCRREIPLLNALQTEYAPRGFEVIGVAVDFHEDVVAFMKEVPVRYPVLIGEQDGLDAAGAFGVNTMAFPFTAFTDRQGRILTVHMGEIHEPEARAILGVVERVNAGELDVGQARTAIEQALAALPKTPATGTG